LLAILCVAALVTTARSADEPVGPEKLGPLLEKGSLQEVRKPVAQVFTFTFDGERLKIDRANWARADKANPKAKNRIMFRGMEEAPIDGLFWQISENAGLGGSGMSGNGTSRTLDFSGGTMGGRLRVQGDSIRLSLEEAGTTSRTLTFQDDGQGAISLQLTHPDGEVLLFNQARDGRCNVVMVSGDEVFRGRGKTFLACFRQHRDAMEKRVLPVLAHYGIELFLSPQAPQVRQAVLALLARTPETLAEGQRLIDELDAKDFATREKAGQRLSEKFALYEDLIRQKLQGKPSLELQRRLDKIIAEHADAPRVGQTVAALDLLQDTRYLVMLLDGAPADDATRLAGQLGKVTGQKLGTDPTAWKEWVKKNGK
jgi:hypothetical protein